MQGVHTYTNTKTNKNTKNKNTEIQRNSQSTNQKY